MDQSNGFKVVGPGYLKRRPRPPKETWRRKLKGRPVLSLAVFSLIAGGCLLAGLIANHDPSEFYLANLNQAPDSEFYFGTDSLGRDLFSVIWHGGRASLAIGLLSTLMMTVIGVIYGCLSGCSKASGDNLMMRGVELIQSVPTLLTVLLIISLMGRQNVFTLSLVIGGVTWFALARIVRGEVRQIRNSEYILASRCMGAGFGFRMRKHLIPNFVSAIMFVVISSIAANMGLESTLSFLGLGLPVETLSWGGLLALADRALLLNTWWVIVIPGLFLVVTLLCITNLGHYFRRHANRQPSNLV